MSRQERSLSSSSGSPALLSETMFFLERLLAFQGFKEWSCQAKFGSVIHVLRKKGKKPVCAWKNSGVTAEETIPTRMTFSEITAPPEFPGEVWALICNVSESSSVPVREL